jgi:hypothetical protein
MDNNKINDDNQLNEDLVYLNMEFDLSNQNTWDNTHDLDLLQQFFKTKIISKLCGVSDSTFLIDHEVEIAEIRKLMEELNDKDIENGTVGYDDYDNCVFCYGSFRKKALYVVDHKESIRNQCIHHCTLCHDFIPKDIKRKCSKCNVRIEFYRDMVEPIALPFLEKFGVNGEKMNKALKHFDGSMIWLIWSALWTFINSLNLHAKDTYSPGHTYDDLQQMARDASGYYLVIAVLYIIHTVLKRTGWTVLMDFRGLMYLLVPLSANIALGCGHTNLANVINITSTGLFTLNLWGFNILKLSSSKFLKFNRHALQAYYTNGRLRKISKKEEVGHMTFICWLFVNFLGTALVPAVNHEIYTITQNFYEQGFGPNHASLARLGNTTVSVLALLSAIVIYYKTKTPVLSLNLGSILMFALFVANHGSLGFEEGLAFSNMAAFTIAFFVGCVLWCVAMSQGGMY